MTSSTSLLARVSASFIVARSIRFFRSACNCHIEKCYSVSADSITDSLCRCRLSLLVIKPCRGYDEGKNDWCVKTDRQTDIRFRRFSARLYLKETLSVGSHQRLRFFSSPVLLASRQLLYHWISHSAVWVGSGLWQ